MAIMLIFPEYVLAIGTWNSFASRENNKALEELARIDGVPWSRTHTIQADIGGIALRFSNAGSEQASLHGSILHGSIHGLRRGSIGSQKVESPSSAAHGKAVAAAHPQGDFSDIILPQMTNETSLDDCERSYHGHAISNIHMEQISNASTRPLAPPEPEIPQSLSRFQENQESHLKHLDGVPWTPSPLHTELAAKYIRSGDRATLNNANNVAPFHGNIWIMDSKQLCIAREFGIISRLPCIRTAEIEDKNKILKLLAILQVLWLVTQFIVRMIQKLSSSALEYSTMAFTVCATILYIIEWQKPQDVALPIYFDTDAIVTLEAFKSIVEASPSIFMRNRHYFMPQSSIHQVIERRFKTQHLDWLIVGVSVMASSLFGGIHLLAWNIEFPTPIERTLWRTTSLLVTMIPSICAICVLFESLIFGTTHRMSKWSSMLFSPFSFASRIFLIVESFRALYFLPPDALTATWVTYVPHIR